MKTFLISLLLWGAAAPCQLFGQTQEACRWNFDPPTAGTLMPTSQNASLVSGSPISWGSPEMWAGWITGASLDPVNDRSPMIDDWPTGPAPFDANRWVGASLTINSEKSGQPVSFKGRFSRTSTAPTTYEMRCSIDNWQSSLVVSSWNNTATNDWNSLILNVDLSSLPVLNAGETFSFRIFGREADVSTGRVKLDSLRILVKELVPLTARAMLAGPLNGPLMDDGLHIAGFIPLTEPYSALGHVPTENPGATISLTALSNYEDGDAIVDWVFVELRSAVDAGIVVASQALLLQRDGDIVALDGYRRPAFDVPVASYRIAVRHRNHLPVMTANPSAPGILVDFTSTSTATWGTEGQVNVNGVMAMHSGDVDMDGTVKYTGAGNDRDLILVDVGSATPNASSVGYYSTDVSMDGTVKYTGTKNDRDPILVAVGSMTPNSVRTNPLP